MESIITHKKLVGFYTFKMCDRNKKKIKRVLRLKILEIYFKIMFSNKFEIYIKTNEI